MRLTEHVIADAAVTDPKGERLLKLDALPTCWGPNTATVASGHVRVGSARTEGTSGYVVVLVVVGVDEPNDAHALNAVSGVVVVETRPPQRKQQRIADIAITRSNESPASTSSGTESRSPSTSILISSSTRCKTPSSAWNCTADDVE